MVVVKLFFKKGQLQIQETIIVIFIFIVLLLLGFVFFYRYTAQSIENEKFKFDNTKFNLLIADIPNRAEFKCSELMHEDECLDALKLMAFSKVSEDYREEFGFKSIYVEKVYPEGNLDFCNQNNYPNCGKFEVYSNEVQNYNSKFVISTPVSLYFDGKYVIGKLIIEWYL